jgi:hypothetical protein
MAKAERRAEARLQPGLAAPQKGKFQRRALWAAAETRPLTDFAPISRASGLALPGRMQPNPRYYLDGRSEFARRTLYTRTAKSAPGVLNTA